MLLVLYAFRAYVYTHCDLCTQALHLASDKVDALLVVRVGLRAIGRLDIGLIRVRGYRGQHADNSHYGH